ncbi:hypothetical protein BZA05DRAFT_360139 [Tricharina praecox]|uniref:uncharacterized protein n=1 Tax=Tricharina praecox TaxID=43433 RepID=UPI002220386A|nr:uncharacterized protein BZA05DRAFT_360139 [Tricharina praecox]KAI5842078.1 hypothetical protein BZA05DRAFT_360139 [Tricharina praecox]
MSTTSETATAPSSKFRGATVEDLDLAPALSITPETTIEAAHALAYERDYSQLTVVNERTRALLGYVDSRTLTVPKFFSSPNRPVSAVMHWFDRRRRAKPYSVITPATPLEELQGFFEQGGEQFAVVTDPARRFVLGVATRGDLEEFLKRRPE